MSTSLKDLFGIARPGGVDDVIVRAVKMFVFVFLSSPFANAIAGDGVLDLDAALAAVHAGVAAFTSVVFNGALAWASTSGQKTGSSDEVDRDALDEFDSGR